ncbi:conserved hypothetical protein [Hyella patelloides LEGE 07179]|uniref:Uncharacterized protein n=1 Tax=Hyella patelloides LEGE 07179 TaxID=945734 RepID=A0A563VSH8_9CYAN|nr:conserved hypothetical protein [Hyella patelloides LEGE 07179]
MIPNNPQSKTQTVSIEQTNEKALQLASKMILRTVLIVPMLFLLKNAL